MSAIQKAKWEVEEEGPVVSRYQRRYCSPHSVHGESSVHDHENQADDNHHAKDGLRVRKQAVCISAPTAVQIRARAKVQVEESVRVVENERAGQSANDCSPKRNMSADEFNQAHD